MGSFKSCCNSVVTDKYIFVGRCCENEVYKTFNITKNITQILTNKKKNKSHLVILIFISFTHMREENLLYHLEIAICFILNNYLLII